MPLHMLLTHEVGNSERFFLFCFVLMSTLEAEIQAE